MIDQILDLQRWLYDTSLTKLDVMGSAGAAQFPALLVAAFGFGALHALLPGHGKLVMTSRYAAGGGALEAVATTSVLILLHVGSAVVIAVGGFAIITRTIGGAGRAPALEAASQIMIVAVGAWMLWRALRSEVPCDGRQGFALAIAAGAVPCPLTFFVMSYAIPRGLLGEGLLFAIAYALGMILTVASLPVLAVLLRSEFASWMAWTAPLRARAATAVSVAAALAIIAVGLLPWIRSTLG